MANYNFPAPVFDAPPTDSLKNSVPRPDAAGGVLEYYRILYRRKIIIGVVILLAVAASIIATFAQPRVYQARTTLEIQDINDNFLNMKQVTPLSEGNSDADLTDTQTRMQLLQSESLIKRALAKVRNHLAENSGTEKPAEAGATSVEEPHVHTPAAAYHFQLPSPKPGAGWLAAIQSMGRNYDVSPACVSRNLKVRVTGQTRILEILYDSPDPQFAAAFANTLAQEFIASSMEARLNMNQHTSEWLSRQLEEMRIKLERSEDDLQAYARQRGLLFASNGTASDTTNIADDKLRQTQQELSKAQADRMARQARWELMAAAPPDHLPEVFNDSSLRNLQDKVTELRRQRAELITTYTEKHSKVQRVEAQTAPLEAALQQERAALLERIRTDYEAAVRREKLLATDYAAQSRLVSDQAQKAIKYNILKREADSNRQLYEAMLQRVKESTIASAMRASNIRVVDPAEPPSEPYKPSLPKNCAFGFVSGFVLSAALAILQQKTSSRLRDTSDVQLRMNFPQLGVIPRAPKELGIESRKGTNKRTALAKPVTLSLNGLIDETVHAAGRMDSILAQDEGAVGADGLLWDRKPGLVTDSFRSVVTSILFSDEKGDRPRVLVVTSASPAEGKTTVACNLGMSFADIRQRVLIIDGDIRKPRVHEIFGVENVYGLTTLLTRDGIEPDAIQEAVRPAGIPGLFVLPAGFANGGAENPLYRATLAELLERFKREFDTVIIDTPPMLQMPDARVLGRLADGVVLVMRSCHTRIEAAVAAGQRFREDRTPILGTILNDWDPKHSPTSYNYTYYQEPA